VETAPTVADHLVENEIVIARVRPAGAAGKATVRGPEVGKFKQQVKNVKNAELAY
jgi:hypothetical protein